MKRIGLSDTFLSDYFSATGARLIPYSFPLTISGCQLYLDASLIDGLNDNDAVETWIDYSGNSRDAVQTTTSYKPIIKTGVINAKPVVRFGGGTYVKMGVPAFSLEQFDLFVVCIPIAFSTTYPVVIQQDNVNTGLIIIVDNGSAPYRPYYRNVSGTNITFQAATSLSLNTPYVLEMSQDATTLAATRNGVSEGSAASTPTSKTKTLTIGNSEVNGNQFGGDIAEVIIYNRCLTSTERTNLVNYLKSKYGVS